MAARTRAGVPGTETPRDKDMPVGAGSGRKVTPDTDKRAKKAIRRALLAFLTEHGADAAARQRWDREYRAFVLGLPSRSASVADLVASRVRNAYLAERYALEAQVAGTSTPAGAKLAAMAHGCDMHVQRFALHARDLSAREAGVEDAAPASTERTPADARQIMRDLFPGGVGPTARDFHDDEGDLDGPDPGPDPTPPPVPETHLDPGEWTAPRPPPDPEPARVRVAPEPVEPTPAPEAPDYSLARAVRRRAFAGDYRPRDPNTDW
ncbi:MAG TPA: hypothetical protein VGG39_26820 [Polyangiaceae bacterium]|jgi:hypothetical protein